MGQTFDWQRQGLIFCPDGRYDWMQTYAQNPTGILLEDRIRVFFTCRPNRAADGSFTSVTTFVDLDRQDPSRVLRVSDKPTLARGKRGAFDEFGVMPGGLMRVDDKVHLYYVGWTRNLGVPYHHAIGLAVSDNDGETFERYGDGPIITRTPQEPYIQNSPFATRLNGKYHMWYSTGLGWVDQDDKPESVYVVTHATSDDGVHWDREGDPCVPFRVEHECQTNPCVIELGGKYHMWFCFRHGLDFRNRDRGYRIGYACSDDLKTWHRDDAVGELLPSDDGWDSMMTCYPWVIREGDQLIMFYSGNFMGRDGFGYATAPLT